MLKRLVTPKTEGCAGKIFVIDDDVDLLNFTEFILCQNGYRVETSSDPIESLKKDIPFVADVILVDILMPKMSGIGLLDFLNQSAKDWALRLSSSPLCAGRRIFRRPSMQGRTIILSSRFPPMGF